MEYKTEIVVSTPRLKEVLGDAPPYCVVDVETKGELDAGGELLGIAIAFRPLQAPSDLVAFYVPFVKWDFPTKTLLGCCESGLPAALSSFLAEHVLIGHQIEYDRLWIDEKLGIKSLWKADTRKMWHLADDKDSKHGFGLKTAQTELLKWSETNDADLEREVESRGGRLSDGDHYLSSIDILGRYACLDVVSTLLVFEKLSPFFDENNYWEFLDWRQSYHQILTEATRKGIEVDAIELLNAKEELAVRCEKSEKKIREICKEPIEQLEECWAETKARKFKKSGYAEKFMQDRSKWQVFNPNSGMHRSELLHGMLQLPVGGRTPTGRPKSDRDTIARLNHPAAEAFCKLSEDRKNLQFAEGYLDSLRARDDGSYTIHFPYNTSATVSDRLGGFKPYCLNMPFSEESLMKVFKLPKGYVGIHADLAAIEPCLIAAYSEDPTLLKVHRDGLGDVYLDLALESFPENEALTLFYDPMKPCTADVKKKFKALRDMCKVVHLAVSYTGSAFTVHRNLVKRGHEISLDGAAYLVNKYWQKFEAVARFDRKLKTLAKNQGHLRGILGRIIKVPSRFEKDTMNRFIQSGGHDCLTAWVMGIDQRRKENPGLGMYPILPDIHDSSSWAVKEEYYEDAKSIFSDSLAELNTRLSLPVSLRAEVKKFHTLHGLKGDEE